jgi:hypothetical protein
MFFGSAPEARPAGYLFMASATLGLIAAAFYSPLIPYAFIGILLAICGFSVIGVARPEWV